MFCVPISCCNYIPLRVLVLLLVVTFMAGIPVSGQQLSLGNRHISDTGYIYLHSGCKTLLRIPVMLYNRPDSSDITAVRAVRKSNVGACTGAYSFFSSTWECAV